MPVGLSGVWLSHLRVTSYTYLYGWSYTQKMGISWKSLMLVSASTETLCNVHSFLTTGVPGGVACVGLSFLRLHQSKGALECMFFQYSTVCFFCSHFELDRHGQALEGCFNCILSEQEKAYKQHTQALLGKLKLCVSVKYLLPIGIFI